MGNIYQITEYGSFVRDKDAQGYISLPQGTFDALENFILANNSKKTDALELMGLSAKKGIGKVITAKKYVGVISMNDGTTIEILPKIYSSEAEDAGKTKKLLIEMLKTLRKSPFKSLQTTNVDIDKMNIFEVFIRMFIDEVFFVVKRGLKCNYETIQTNGSVFKGKLKFSEHIRYNFAHKERCYVEYDEFNINRVENKLLKSTLLYLYRHSVSSKNKNDIKTLLNYFNEVEESRDYEGDFAKIVPERNTKDYDTALLWSKIFLMGKSFTSFSGSYVAFALLFSMEKLFESYIATQMNRLLKGTDCNLSVQDRKYYLFDKPRKRFLMKPDIVIRDKVRKNIFVMDTKWKVLSDSKSNYGISQADMYQMYAYQKKYNATNMTIIYPMTNKVKNKDIFYQSEDGVIVRICFVDLYNLKESLVQIVDICHINYTRNI